MEQDNDFPKLNHSKLIKFASVWAKKYQNEGLQRITLHEYIGQTEKYLYALLFWFNGKPAPNHQFSGLVEEHLEIEKSEDNRNEHLFAVQDEESGKTRILKKIFIRSVKIPEKKEGPKEKGEEDGKRQVFESIDRSITFMEFINQKSFSDAYYNQNPQVGHEDEWFASHIGEWFAYPIFDGEPLPEFASSYSWELYPGSIDPQSLIGPQKEAEKSQPELQNNTKTPPEHYGAEDFIRSVSISYESDNEIGLKIGDKKTKNYTCKDMEFKPDSKPWKLLMKILKDGQHEYNIGTYSLDKISEKNRDYNNKVHTMREFSKKLVSFLNKTYGKQMPEKFSVFENKQKIGKGRAGIYVPKFKIIDIGLTEMTKDETIRMITGLCEKIKNEKAGGAKERLTKQLYPYLDHAKKKGWISKEDAISLLISDNANADN